MILSCLSSFGLGSLLYCCRFQHFVDWLCCMMVKVVELIFLEPLVIISLTLAVYSTFTVYDTFNVYLTFIICDS
jgi:hypothetical protein